MKRILFVIPTLGGGGAERVLVTLLNNLNKDKYDITLLSLFNSGTNKKLLEKHIKYKYFFKRMFRGNIHFLKLFTPKLLYKCMVKDKYDIVVSYLEGPTTRIVGGCPDNDIKLLNWVHTEINAVTELTKSYRNQKELLDTYRKYNSSIFVSDSARQAFKNTFKNFEGDMLVKYNTVDTKSIVGKSEEAIDDIIIDQSKINLISVGRFTELKGYLRLLKVMKLLINDKMNIHLYLLGKGELEHKYREYIEKNGLKKHVTILGFKDNPYKYIRKCNLFVCSSYKEGYSTAVTESLLVGTPVVTTLCSGMKEMLGSNNEYGVITDNNDKALYQGIKRMLIEPGLLNHYKIKANERGKTFSTEKTVNAIEEMLDNL